MGRVMTHSIDAASLRQVLGHYPTGVTVVTAIDASASPAGMTVGSFTSVSLDPPLVGFFADQTSSSFPRIRRAASFCANILGADQEQVCRSFAAKTDNKFRGLTWHAAPSGAPILEGVVAWIDCDFERIEQIGDHYAVYGRVRDLEIDRRSLPLLFFRGGYGGFTPLSLTAATESDIIDQLRLVDTVRPAMELLSAQLNVECLATAAVGNELITLAVSGKPAGRLVPTQVGQRFPFAPPLGALFIAHSSNADPVRQAWLGRLHTGCSRRLHQEILAELRTGGWSIGLGDPTQSELEAALSRVANYALDAHTERDGLRLLRAINQDRCGRKGSRTYQVRSMTAPILDVTGKAALTVSLCALPSAMTQARVRQYRDALLQATSAALAE
jgi:flavin reductase (DIM6/NTAB) family NADH-FMN oxidoreductase RutF/DNA-binding IclR family transcriptional regulator